MADSTLEERLAERPDVEVFVAVSGSEFAYRPRLVLVDERDAELVRPHVHEAGGKEGKRSVPGIVSFEVPEDVDVVDLVRKLRAIDADTPPRVGPANILFGVGRFCGWPGSDPEPAPKLGPASGRIGDPEQPGAGVTIAVIDTGLDARARKHPLLDGVEVRKRDVDPTVDATPVDSFIDDQAGHAAFIAGIIRQVAPGAAVHVLRALDTQGVGDEVTVAHAIDRAVELGADVINLSLGGYTEGDRPPLAIVAALARVPRTTAVIAAAGNLSSTRLTWPAALKRVVAVGAVDDAGAPATFTNAGWWVDACTAGVGVHSVYVSGDENPANETDGTADAFDGHAFWSGSSFSCGRVSALVAKEMQAGGGSAREAAVRLLEDPGARVVADLGVLLA